MAHKFACQTCSAELSITDKVFDERIAGRRVSIRCRRCNSTLVVTGDERLGRAPADVDADQRLDVASAPTPPEPHHHGVHWVDGATPRRPPSLHRGRTSTGNSPPSAPQAPATEGAPIAPLAHGAAGITRAKPAIPPRRSISTATAIGNLPTNREPQRQIEELTEVTPLAPELLPKMPAEARDSHSPSLSETVTAMPIVSVEARASLGTAEESEPVAAQSAARTPTPVASASPAPDYCPDPEFADFFSEPERELTPPATTVQIADSHLSDPVMLGGTATSIGAGWAHGESIFSRRRRIARKAVAALMAVAVVWGLAMGAIAGRLKHSPRAVAAAASSGARAMGKDAIRLPPTTLAAAGTGASTDLSPGEPPSTAPVPIVPATSDVPNEGVIPDYVFKPAVIHLTGVAIHRAERCHPKGHAVGTARVFFTFSPSGRVTEARVEGEPIASAPVARCILDHALAIRMRKFDGAPFTVSSPITLR